MANSEKAQELLDRLHEKVETLVTGDDWKAALDFQAKFHRYSFNNSMLIQLQKPGATYVMGYGAKDGRSGWLSVGRQVRKGEKGIAILAPIVVKRDKADGSKGTAVVGFRTVYVFDISQTDGDDLPLDVMHPAELQGDAAPELFASLVSLVADRGFEYVDDDAKLPGGALGVTIPQAKTVTVKSDMSPLQRTKTLVHELAHVALHCNADEAFDYSKCRGQAEVEAESVAYVVCAALGLPTDDYSFAYVGGWSGGDMELVRKSGERVARIAKSILEGVSA